jgi:hypothetical protein
MHGADSQITCGIQQALGRIIDDGRDGNSIGTLPSEKRSGYSKQIFFTWLYFTWVY